jgi:1-deoxy-D-xylulose-5-phosphate reductoisomerase
LVLADGKKTKKNVVLLGSTGSVGRNALQVLRDNPDRFRLAGIAAGTNIDLLEQQIREFEPELVAVQNAEGRDSLSGLFPRKKIFSGPDALSRVVSEQPVDCVISAVRGTDSLRATLASIELNQRICLASKEIMVAAGELVNRKLENSRAEIIPIDSEQCAIFQCLGDAPNERVHKVILTASGGPFLNRDQKDFAHVSPQEALSHPVWSMGKKITIDSATLMNKALEIIEAYYLFHLKPDQIEAVIHPQSIIHSMVEFVDGTILAQLSVPDMKIPIAYSLSYPERIPGKYGRVDFLKCRKLEFFEVDPEKFSSIRMAHFVLRTGGNAGAVFNTANEVAVEYYLNGKISFRGIFQIVDEMLQREKFYPVGSFGDIEDTIARTRGHAVDYIEKEVMK